MGLAFTEFVHSGQEMHSQNRRRSICFQVLFHALLLMGRGVLTPLNYLLAPGWGCVRTVKRFMLTPVRVGGIKSGTVLTQTQTGAT